LVCKIGQGKKSCIYGAVSRDGFECLRGTEIRKVLERKADERNLVARSRGEDCTLEGTI